MVKRIMKMKHIKQSQKKLGKNTENTKLHNNTQNSKIINSKSSDLMFLQSLKNRSSRNLFQKI